MIEICILIDCIAFGLRVYYYQRAVGNKKMESVFFSLNRLISLEYLLPIKEKDNDSNEVTRWKKNSNLYLNLFYMSMVFTFFFVAIRIKNDFS